MDKLRLLFHAFLGTALGLLAYDEEAIKCFDQALKLYSKSDSQFDIIFMKKSININNLVDILLNSK